MIKNISLLFVLSLLTACSDGPTEISNPNYRTSIDPALQPYVEDFVAIAKINGINPSLNTTISFKPRPLLPNQMGVVGLCIKQVSNSGEVLKTEILIAEDFWASTTELGRTHIMYHELGHCFLNRPHLSTTIARSTANGVVETPISLMYPAIFSTAPANSNFVFDNFQAYLNELFTENASSILAHGPLYNSPGSAVFFSSHEEVQVIHADGSCSE